METMGEFPPIAAEMLREYSNASIDVSDLIRWEPTDAEIAAFIGDGND